MNVPKRYWGAVVLTASQLINKMPSRVLNFQTLSAVLSLGLSRQPQASAPIKIFGYVCYVRVYKQDRSKLRKATGVVILLRKRSMYLWM